MEETFQSYKGLRVWREAMALAEMCYRFTHDFPRAEQFGLTAQIRRASTSIPANIAEGAEREGTREFLQFLSVAAGSLAEVETYLILAERLRMLTSEQTLPLLDLAEETGRMLNGLKRSLRSKI